MRSADQLDLITDVSYVSPTLLTGNLFLRNQPSNRHKGRREEMKTGKSLITSFIARNGVTETAVGAMWQAGSARHATITAHVFSPVMSSDQHSASSGVQVQ